MENMSVDKFRLQQQLEICEAITSLTNGDDFLAFVDLFAKQLNVKDAQTFLVKLFLQRRYELDPESTNIVAQFAEKHNEKRNQKRNPKRNEKQQKKDNNSGNNHTCHNNNNMFNLLKNNKDEFGHIGAFLSVRSSLNLSICNRLMHKLVQNSDYFSHCNETKQLRLNSKQLRTICENKSHLDYFVPNCKILHIACDEPENVFDCRRVISSNIEKKCMLCQLFNTNNNYNFEYAWIHAILSKIDRLYISNQWHCAWDQLPMKSLFNKRNNSNNNSIKVIGSHPTRDHALFKQAIELFATKYDRFITETYGNGSNSLNYVRKIDRLWFRNETTDLFTVLRLFHDNCGTISLNLNFENNIEVNNSNLINIIQGWKVNYYNSNQNKFSSLSQFFTVFHSNVVCLDLGFGKNSNNSNATNQNCVVSQIFKNRHLIRDFNATDEMLSFEELLLKHAHTNDNDKNAKNIAKNNKNLPQIRTFDVRVAGSEACDMLDEFLDNRKLLRLFNLRSTVTELKVLCFNKIKMQFIDKTLKHLIETLTNMTRLNIIIPIDNYRDYNPNIENIVFKFERDMLEFFENFFNHYLIDMLYSCLRFNNSLKALRINWGGSHVDKSIDFETIIDINSKNGLLNRKQCKELISLKIVNCEDDVKRAWNQEKQNIIDTKQAIIQTFVLQRKYQL